uniref:Endonuclease/exonuclease/phosphatase domain-containing protein n=1 Tax=Panagrolaimus sp. JU765 TaxID=591449 RepID=A0AC34RNK1_9BILA
MRAIFDSTANFAQLQENKATELFNDSMIGPKNIDEFIEYLQNQIYPLDVFLWNAHSISDFESDKYLMLKTLAKICESTIFCITETWLDRTKLINLSDFGNHEIIRCDRNVQFYEQGAGICCFLPKIFDFIMRFSADFDEFQFLCIDLFPIKPETLRLIIVYVREKKLSEEDYQTLIEMLQKFTTNINRLLIVGDFNAPNINWLKETKETPVVGGNETAQTPTKKKKYAETPYEKSLRKFIESKQLEQYVKYPTYKKSEETAKSLLDLVLTNNGISVSNLIYFPYDLSDHRALKFQVFNETADDSSSFVKYKKLKKETSEDTQFDNSLNETPVSKFFIFKA